MQMKAGAYIPLTHDCDAEKDLVFDFDDSIDVLTNAHFSWSSHDWCLNSIHESTCRRSKGGFSLWWFIKERISFGGLVGTKGR